MGVLARPTAVPTPQGWSPGATGRVKPGGWRAPRAPTLRSNPEFGRNSRRGWLCPPAGFARGRAGGTGVARGPHSGISVVNLIRVVAPGGRVAHRVLSFRASWTADHPGRGTLHGSSRARTGLRRSPGRAGAARHYQWSSRPVRDSNRATRPHRGPPLSIRIARKSKSPYKRSPASLSTVQPVAPKYRAAASPKGCFSASIPGAGPVVT